jgi:ribosomal-protein-alanine N-acetyltransferase
MSEGKFSNTGFVVETSRLLLRPMSLGDLDALFSLFSDPDIIKYLAPTKPMDRDEVEAALQSIIAHWERHGFGRLAVIHKDDGKVIGYSGLRMLEGTPEVIYTVAKQYWGAGLATEAAKASLRFGFENLGFERIVAIAKPENLASRHILEKIGLQFQGESNYYGHTMAFYELARCHYRPDENFFYKVSHQQIPDILAQNMTQAHPQVL